MPNIFWTIHTSEGRKYADSITAEWPNLTVGGRSTIRVHFQQNGARSLSGSTSETVSSGSVEGDDSVDISGSASLTVNGTLHVGDEESRWSETEQYTDYAGHAANGVGLNNVPWFKEQLAADASVQSIVMGFEPSGDLKNRTVRGFWGLLVGGRDRRNNVLSQFDLELECVVLAEFDEYGSIDTLKSDLEA